MKKEDKKPRAYLISSSMIWYNSLSSHGDWRTVWSFSVAKDWIKRKKERGKERNDIVDNNLKAQTIKGRRRTPRKSKKGNTLSHDLVWMNWIL